MLCSLQKMENRFTEIEVSAPGAKDKMRSAPILDQSHLEKAFSEAPDDVEHLLLELPVAHEEDVSA